MGAESSKFKEGVRCLLSDPANPHTLSHGLGLNPPCGCFNCSDQKDSSEIDFHYCCISCNVGFHDECYKFPRKVRHPYHSQHPLSLIVRDDETKIAISEAGKSNKCNWCAGDLNDKFYRCSLCGFCLDLSCVEKSPHPTIKNPKIHQHPLVFFPRPFPLPCDACGLVRISEPVYTCFQCNYMVHESCTNLPQVIKITRHPHRLSYTPFSRTGNSTCQICYKSIDIKYGHFLCNQDGCSYAAHSLCATDENVWDGNELEWVPEETNKTEDLEPFEKVGVDLIKYFCHEHHLRLQQYDVARDADKQCHSCILHIGSHDFYHCTQCDFYLHEINKKPAILVADVLPVFDMNVVTMIAKATYLKWIFDAFWFPIITHKSHEHPLFISTCSTSEDEIICQGCKSKIPRKSHLRCTLCKFALCYHCATIPSEIYYKHDKHPLSLCHGEEVDETYWCEICEKEIDSTNWFYTCNRCCITIHRECIFGSSVYMKSGSTFNRFSQNLKVVCNTSNTRPICSQCGKYCPDSIYYKSETIWICSIDCLINLPENKAEVSEEARS